MAYTFSNELISDLHKDARGFRPSGAWLLCYWETETDAQKQATWDSLIAELEEENERVRRWEEEAVKDFEADVNLHIALGAGDRETALRWMTQNEEFYHDQCIEHWVWNRDILFTDYGRDLVKELKSIITLKEYE
jgi:hypothetical protein